MNGPSQAQLETARRLLAYEVESSSGDHSERTAAGRVYGKLTAELAPLLGAVGVEALLVRSLKLALKGPAIVNESWLAEGSTKLREWLETGDPAVVADTAPFLFGTFIALLASFIGERLTGELLSRAWPNVA